MAVRVFVSYANDDVRAGAEIEQVASALRCLLGDNGVFHDRNSIPLGSDWRREISRGLEDCDVLVFMMGPALAQPERMRQLVEEGDVLGEELRFARKMAIPVLGIALGTPPLNKVATALPVDLEWLTQLQWIECGAKPSPGDLDHIQRKVAEALARVTLNQIVLEQDDRLPWLIDAIANLDAAQTAAMQTVLPAVDVHPKIRRAIAEVLRLRGVIADPGPDPNPQPLPLGITLMAEMQGQCIGKFDRSRVEKLRAMRRDFRRQFASNLPGVPSRERWSATGAHTEILMLAADRNSERRERLQHATATRMRILASDVKVLSQSQQQMLERVRAFIFGQVLVSTPSDYTAFVDLRAWPEVRRRRTR